MGMPSKRVVDARGMFCPGPLLEAIKAVEAAGPGDEIEILATDRGSTRDVPLWARRNGHTVASVENAGDHFRIVIIKGR